MKILNLYAGVGGNRKLWGDEHQITAVEYDPDIAAVYQALYPNDTVVVGDAHQYLLDNLNDYDFIWSSPPCQTHSQIRYNLGYKADRKYRKVAPKYPDMKLYEEILLLNNWFEGKYVVENTVSYYRPLIPARTIAKHFWWSNFPITSFDISSRGHRGGTVPSLQELKGIDLTGFDLTNKRQILRNCVEPETGLHVLNCAIASTYQPTTLDLFEVKEENPNAETLLAR